LVGVDGPLGATLDRDPLYIQVADRILDRIVLGQLQLGTRLPSERSLSEQFRVSRVVIREAMKVLVSSGVVVVEPGRGVFTTDRTRESLSNSFDLLFRMQGLDHAKILEVRAPIEIVVAGLAASRADAADIAGLEAHNEEMARCAQDVDRRVAADEQFHLALAAATKNELFQALAQPLVVFLREARRTMASRALHSGASINALERHRELLAAIERRDVAAARKVMRRHMDEVAAALGIAPPPASSPEEERP
jgi:GntR family transcriptional repressor for pyruvate dehydrogenase complex